MNPVVHLRTAGTELELELAKSKQMVKKWAEEQRSALGETTSQYKREMTHLNEDMAELRSKEKQIKEEIARLTKLAEKESAEIDSAKARVKQLKDKENSLPLKLSDQQKILSREMENLEAQKQKKEEAEAERQHRLAELTHGVQFYCDRLGLRFSRSKEDEPLLRFAFTQVVKDDPERVFEFTLRVDDNNVYQLHSCTPPVGSLDKLITELNATNNFAGFVQKMRALFKASAQ